MIEGINSSLITTTVGRAAIESVASANVKAVEVTSRNRGNFVEPYISPFVKIDANAAVRAVLQVRDSASGEVIRQYPTESQLAAFARSQEVLQTSQVSNAARLQAAARTQAAAVERTIRSQQNTSTESPAPEIAASTSPAPEIAASTSPAPEIAASTSPAPTPAPAAAAPNPAPEANVVAAQQFSQAPQTTVSEPVGFSAEV